MSFYNISHHIHMYDKVWHLSNSGSAFLHLNVGNSAMPLKPFPKRRPYVIFFMLYEFRVVCVLYWHVCVCVLLIPGLCSLDKILFLVGFQSKLGATPALESVCPAHLCMKGSTLPPLVTRRTRSDHTEHPENWLLPGSVRIRYHMWS